MAGAEEDGLGHRERISGPRVLETVLREVMAQIKAKAKRPLVRVEGHTDAKGTDAYNQALSQRRAASVRTWFVEAAKLPAKSVTAVGFGERQPVARGDMDVDVLEQPAFALVKAEFLIG